MHGTLIILFYVSPSSPQLQRIFVFLLKTQKNNHSLTSDRWEYIKFCFQENTEIFSKNSTTQENITISRQNWLFVKNNHFSASDWQGNTKSSFKGIDIKFTKNSTTEKNIKTLRLKKD